MRAQSYEHEHTQKNNGLINRSSLNTSQTSRNLCLHTVPVNFDTNHTPYLLEMLFTHLLLVVH